MSKKLDPSAREHDKFIVLKVDFSIRRWDPVHADQWFFFDIMKPRKKEHPPNH